MTYVAVGTVVIKNGFKTYRTTGKVLDNDYTTTITSGYKFTNMTKAETYVDDGDSGGIVYTYFDS